MARTPSMTVNEAESMIGPASELIRVDGTNRPLLRKWATAKGYVSADVYKMSNVELMNLYATYAAWQTRSEPAPTYYGAPAATPPAPVTNTAAEQFANALRLLMGNPEAIVDESKVRAIVADEIGKIEPAVKVTRLEISGPAGLTKIEGVVHASTGMVIRVASLAHPVMLVGPAGASKTSICSTVATALNLPLYITSTVFDTHELLGFVDGMGNYHSTAFRQAFEHGGVWVADEIDAWDAAALLAANSALANGFATFPDTPVPVLRHANFRIVATANTYGHGADRVYVGRNQLDAASLDRFAVIAIDYDRDLEVALSGGNELWLDRVTDVRMECRAKNIRHVVSTRAIIMGSQALAAGISQANVEEMYLFKGMSESDRKKII